MNLPLFSKEQNNPKNQNMKKCYLIVFLFITGVSLFSQTRITQEQLVGDWKLTKGEGKEFEDDVIGSIFHFQKSGILVADKPSFKEDQTVNQKKGTWKVASNTIVLYNEDEDPKKDKGLVLEVNWYEGDLLSVYDTETKIIIVFERVKE